MPWPAISGALPWTGSNSDGNRARRVEVRRGRDADRPGAGGAEVGQDVPEQVARDDHVEPMRVADEVRGQDVDVVVVDPHVGILAASIAATRSSQNGIEIEMPLLLVQLVRCFFGRDRASSNANSQDAIDSRAREDRFLHDEFALGAREHPAADGRVFALGVLPDHEEVDVAGLATGERARDAGHQPHGPEIDVLIELAAELDQRAPERDVIGHLRRPADGTVEDRVVAADLVLPVVGQHRAVLRGNSRSWRTRSDRTRAPDRTGWRPSPGRAILRGRLPCRCRRPESPRSGMISSDFLRGGWPGRPPSSREGGEGP